VAALSTAAKTTWRDIAEQTAAQIHLVLGGNPDADVRDRPVASPVK
jgi:hypothetical protein